MNDELPKLDGTDIHDITDKTPSQLPDPKPKPVDLPPIADWKDGVTLTLGERIGMAVRSIGKAAGEAVKVVADVAQITKFIEAWWIPLAALIVILILLVVFKIL